MDPLTFGSVEVSVLGDGGRVLMAGEIDAALAPDLEAVLAGLGTARRVEVDVRQVTFLDSTGLAFLVRALRGGECTVVVVGPCPPVSHLLELTGIAAHVEQVEEPLDLRSGGAGAPHG